MRRSCWPNLLTSGRIVLMPVVAGAALMGWRHGFLGLLAAALVTDVLDGYLARRLDAHSEFGRKLDSVADYLTLATGLIGLALLWPDVIRREWMWFAAVMGSFFVAMIFCFIWLGRAPCYHTWASKLTVASCSICLIPLLEGWTARPAHIVAVFQVLVGMEEMVIAILVPQHVGEMPSAWHAWRQRRLRTHRSVMAGS